MVSSGLGLHALLCCVFDKDEGPVVHCSDPPSASEMLVQVRALGKYLLPESFVGDRVVSVVLDDHLVIGAPVYIEDTQYDRNCFQFNICMVISSHVDTAPHRDLAQHLATSFRLLEVDLKFLSQPGSVTPVQPVLASLREQLNVGEECFVKINSSYCISFRIRCQHLRLAPAMSLEEVPLPLVDLTALLLQPGQQQLPYQPDLALLKLLPFIDGVRTVGAIADASGLEGGAVILCLRHLLHFGLVAIIDDIQREKRYCLTPEFHIAFERDEVRSQVVRYVTAGQNCKGTEADVEMVAGLYAAIDGWNMNLGEYQEVYANDLNAHGISLRHFITFGMLQGFLERIDIHTQVLSEEEEAELLILRAMKIPRKKNELGERIRKELTDKIKMGECSEGHIRPEDILSRVNKHPEILSMVERMKELKEKSKEKSKDRVRISTGDAAAKTRRDRNSLSSNQSSSAA